MNLDIGTLIKNFKSTGAKDHPFFWINGASNLVDNLNKLIDFTDYTPKIHTIDYFENPRSNEIKELFKKNGSDKFIHDYYIYYSNILSDVKNIDLLEIGLGTKNPDLPSTMYFYKQDANFDSTPCSCLRSFKQFLNDESNIYGADIDKDILINEDNIHTQYVDQLNTQTIKDLFPDKKFDVIIIDGLHHITADVNSIICLVHRMKGDGQIIIEDIDIFDNWRVVDFILSQKFKTFFIKDVTGQYMYIIKN
jgi:hypothetical protein